MGEASHRAGATTSVSAGAGHETLFIGASFFLHGLAEALRAR
jgi:hypothetical protein